MKKLLYSQLLMVCSGFFISVGMLVKDKLNMNSQKLVVNLSDLAEGMYFVKVICGETSGTHKVLVR